MCVFAGAQTPDPGVGQAGATAFGAGSWSYRAIWNLPVTTTLGTITTTSIEKAFTVQQGQRNLYKVGIVATDVHFEFDSGKPVVRIEKDATLNTGEAVHVILKIRVDYPIGTQGSTKDVGTIFWSATTPAGVALKSSSTVSGNVGGWLNIRIVVIDNPPPAP